MKKDDWFTVIFEIVDKWVKYQEEIGDSKSVPLQQFIQQFKKK